jgi:hypothetical protein
MQNKMFEKTKVLSCCEEDAVVTPCESHAMKLRVTTLRNKQDLQDTIFWTLPGT